jgi:erythrocyte band 7 integral membrane protein
VVTSFGQYTKTLDPGMYYINPMSENCKIVNVRIQFLDLPRQSVITKDNVSVNIDSILFYHVVDPFSSHFKIDNVIQSLNEKALATMRQVFGNYDLQDTISHRDAISIEIEKSMNSVALTWGVKVESLLLKDIQFSQELQENLSAAAKQKRIGAGKVIAAQAEVEAARLMKEASDILSTKAAMQIRYLDTIKQMAKHAQGKIIFMSSNVEEAV